MVKSKVLGTGLREGKCVKSQKKVPYTFTYVKYKQDALL